MQLSLKKAILDHVWTNLDDVQVHNNTVEKFREYIYNSEGGYLEHGGKEVAEFIDQAIKLMRIV